jgi:hypothetical protein
LPKASIRVTVMVAVVVPDGTDVGLATMVEVVADTAPGVTVLGWCCQWCCR